jgi:hypothetical protein
VGELVKGSVSHKVAEQAGPCSSSRIRMTARPDRLPELPPAPTPALPGDEDGLEAELFSIGRSVRTAPHPPRLIASEFAPQVSSIEAGLSTGERRTAWLLAQQR